MYLNFRSCRCVKFHTVDSQFRPSARRQLDITFNYLFTPQTSRWIICNHSKTQSLIELGFPPETRASATVTNVGESSPYDDIREAVGRAVGARLQTLEREDLIKHVWEEVNMNLKSGITLPTFSVLELSFRIVVNQCDFCELPASLRLLEDSEVDRVKVEKKRCSICLDDFSRHHHEGSGRYSGRALRTPCLHVFHGGCFVKWLEKSRRCPLCRLEMPAEEI